MVNTATNINKTNTHLLPQTTEHKKKPQYMVYTKNSFLEQGWRYLLINAPLVLAAEP